MSRWRLSPTACATRTDFWLIIWQVTWTINRISTDMNFCSQGVQMTLRTICSYTTADKMWWAVWFSASQPASGENPPKNDPRTAKTQSQQENPHKQHEGHPQSIQLRGSRRLYHWVPQVSYHRRPPHEDREWKQINLICRNKQKDSPKMRRQRNYPQSKGKELFPERV